MTRETTQHHLCHLGDRTLVPAAHRALPPRLTTSSGGDGQSAANDFFFPPQTFGKRISAGRRGNALHVCSRQVRPQPDGIPGLHDGGRWRWCFARGCRDGPIPSILVSWCNAACALSLRRVSDPRGESTPLAGVKGAGLRECAESTQGPAPAECWCKAPAVFFHVCAFGLVIPRRVRAQVQDRWCRDPCQHLLHVRRWGQGAIRGEWTVKEHQLQA